MTDQPATDTSAGNHPVPQLGVDVGGTSIKGAVVNLDGGELMGEIHTEPTPPTATTGDIETAITRIVASFAWVGPIGVALPGVIDDDALLHAPNLDHGWADKGALARLADPNGTNAVLLNDADAAGLAELTYGDLGPDSSGLTVVLTFGTGIGSALHYRGHLIGGSELGQLDGPHGRFEDVASGRALSEQGLTPTEWARRAQPYFDELAALLNPARWVIAGGLSNEFERFLSRIDLSKPVTVAHLGEHAGIVGAAVAAHRAAWRPTGTEPG